MIVIVFIFFASISIACASNNENTTDDILATDVVVGGNSFDDIQRGINMVSDGGTVFLETDSYKSNSKHIVINKSLTIDGGYDKTILDAKYLSGIFYVDGNHEVILRNLIFENVSAINGSIINQNQGDLTVQNVVIRNIDVTFTNPIAGYAIKLGNNVKFDLSNLEFYNNTVKYNNAFKGIISFGDNVSVSVNRIKYYNNVFKCNDPSKQIEIHPLFKFSKNVSLIMNQLNFYENNFSSSVHYGLISFVGSRLNNVVINGINYTKNNISALKSIFSEIVYVTDISESIYNISNVFHSGNRLNCNSTYQCFGSAIAVVYSYKLNLNINNFNYTDNYLNLGRRANPNVKIKGAISSSSPTTIYNANFKNNVFISNQLNCVLDCGNLKGLENITIENNKLYLGYTNDVPNSKGILCSLVINGILIKNIRIANNFHQYVGISNTSFLNMGPEPFVMIPGPGMIYNLSFENNIYHTGIGLSIQPKSDGLVIVDSCNFFNNTCSASSNISGRNNFYDHGGGMCVNGRYNGSAIIKNCQFIGNTNSQGGALTPHNHCIVENCTFINNTATKFYGGAISTEDGFERNNANVTIRDCYFKNNAAPIGGAIQGKGDYLLIDNCTFKDNYAVQGGAVFLEGENLTVINSRFYDNNATHNLDSRGVVTGQNYLPQITQWDAYGGAIFIQGFNAKLNNNSFSYNSAIHGKNNLIEGKGGAIYIHGDNSSTLHCYFDDNFAHSGNGSAVYVLGVNTTFDVCEFYNHDSSRGTVFIQGSFASILNSIFKANTASSGGAGIYSIGNYSFVYNSTFENNNASIHGGAIHTHGDYIRILKSVFISNNARPNDYNLTHGIGGAIYIRGNFNDVAFCDFEYNTARNGSAIYNNGRNFTIEDSNFHLNQAFSYLLIVMASPEISNYTKNNKITINVTHIGGDNIINAIHNDGDCRNVFFYNVTYEHSSTAGGKRNSGLKVINPVNGVENSNGGKLLYQDPREDLQFIKLTVSREKDANDLLAASINGDIIKEFSGRTGLYGNITFELTGDLQPGKYNVYAEHPEDWLYKQIENSTSFEILSYVDLSIEKSSDKDSYFVGDIATYTITLNSLGSEAHNVVVREILPFAHEIISYTASKGEFKNNTWSIPLLGRSLSETLVLKVLLTSNGTFTNSVNVTTTDNETNLTNNYANKTITVKHFIDLILTKTANIKVVKVGNTVTWTITVENVGTLNATGVKVTDKLSKSLKYLSHIASKGNFDAKSGIWDVGNLTSGESVTLQITTKVLNTGKITNMATVSSNEEESNMTNNVGNFTVSVKSNSDNNNGSEDDYHSKRAAVLKNKYNSKHETGNPLILLLLTLVIIPLRKFKF